MFFRRFQPSEKVFWCLLAGAAGVVHAASPARELLDFTITTNVGFGNEVVVTGNHPDLGNWDASRGAKLFWNTGNVWSGRVAVKSGAAVDYKFVAAPNSATGFCNPVNWSYMPPGDGNHLTTNAPAQPAAPYNGKTIYYHSSWTNAFILYSFDGSNFVNAVMDRVGVGRGAGEYLYRVAGLGEAGEPIQFIPHGFLGGVEGWDNAPYAGYGGGDYYTTLDVIFLQDGDLFNYWPPATVSAPRIINSNVVSTFSPSPSRTMKVYLPRGYDQNTWRRYPVLYMHDGENIFAPGGTYGSWDADLTATKEISQGRMREVIIVGLNSTVDRTREYLPPEDNEGGQGFGDDYCNFLVHNVKQKIDVELRTLTNRENTATAGSSSGGLITTYLGWSTNVFGKIGSFSPAYLISPNFNARIQAEPKQPLRIYTDMGTVELEADLLPDYWTVFDYHLRDGYVPNQDLLGVIGCGQTHNEAAWASRLPAAFHFLFGIWDETNLLAKQLYPSAIKSVAMNQAGVVSGVLDTQMGLTYVVESSPSITNHAAWSGVSTVAVETLPWSNRPFSVTNPAPATPVTYFRAVAR
mgnify:CR=1 FL=1